MHGQGGLPIPDIVHIPQPYWYGEGGRLSPAEFGVKVAHTLEQLTAALLDREERMIELKAELAALKRGATDA